MTQRVIHVEDRHIEMGEKGNPRSCAIALAIKEQFDVDDVSVTGFEFNIPEDFHRRIFYCLSAEASTFVIRFDSGISVEPIDLYFEDNDHPITPRQVIVEESPCLPQDQLTSVF